jgi:thymidylate synthase (FAD)
VGRESGEGVFVEIELRSDIEVQLVQRVGGDYTIVAALRTVREIAQLESLQQDESRVQLEKTIDSLFRGRHGSPFEHASLTFSVFAPVFVWRQWHRHRVGFSYNESSERYGSDPVDPVFWVPRAGRPLLASKGHSPMRPVLEAEHDSQAYEHLLERSRTVYRMAYEHYLEEVRGGIALEVARRLLPISVFSSGWVTCNPRSLMNFLSLRTHSQAASHVAFPQLEIEEAARAIEEIFRQGWPITSEAFDRHGREAP